MLFANQQHKTFQDTQTMSNFRSFSSDDIAIFSERPKWLMSLLDESPMLA